MTGSAPTTVTHPWGEVTYDESGKATLLRFKTHEGKELTVNEPSEQALEARKKFYEQYKDYYADLDAAEKEPDGKVRRAKVTDVIRKHRDPEEQKRLDEKAAELTKTWFQYFESDESRAYMALNDEEYLFDSEKTEWIRGVFAKHQEELSCLWKEVQDAHFEARQLEERIRIMQDHETTKFRKLIVGDYDAWVKQKNKKARVEAKP